MTRLIASLLACALFCGCAAQQAPEQVKITQLKAQAPTKISAPYNVERAKLVLQKGSNEISGTAFVRQVNGGIVTCAGNRVQLFPANEYNDERFGAFLAHSQKGYAEFMSYNGPMRFEPNPPEYTQYTRETVCDAQGKFKFSSTADGDFFIATSVSWKAANNPQGGLFVRRVSVSNGETKELILCP